MVSDPRDPQLSADASGVSWSAVFAGTAGAAALSLILLLLGAAFGFAVVSPWIGAGTTAIGGGPAMAMMEGAGMGGSTWTTCSRTSRARAPTCAKPWKTRRKLRP
jgi:hypothetical protein